MPVLSNTRNPTRDDIIRTLADLQNQQQQRQSYLQAQPYQNFMPNTQLPGFQQRDTQMWDQNLQGIDQLGKNATELSLVIAQNKAAKQAQLRAAQRKKYSQQELAASANAAANTPIPGGSNSYNAITGQYGTAPGLAPIPKFNPHAPIVTRSWRGFSLRMNRSVIGHFVSFLNALSAEGYKIKSVGTYANRNIAGTNVQSLHALGLAMDINPSDNPVTWNGHTVTNLPPNVGALAARYGIKWGGAWLGKKRDSMHFSVPYGGRM
jgi:hypothetical protein